MKPSKYNAFIKEFDNEVRKINAVMTFAIYCLLLFLLKTMYDSLIQISTFSLATMLTLLALFLVIATFMFKQLSNKSVQKITSLAARVDTLLNVTSDIRGEIYSDILLEKILRDAVEMISADGGIIYTIEDSRLVCKLAEGSGLDKLKGSSMPVTEGIPGWVVKSAQIVRVVSGETCPDGECKITGLEGFEFHSYFFAPMIIRSRVIGIIGLFNHQKKAFDKENEAFLSYFADHAAISLENAHFYENQQNYETHITEILLQAMDDHLPIKREHSENVARYSHLIAKAINLPFARERKLHIASMLHDIGFIKFHPNTEMNMKTFQQHCALGYRMLKSIEFYKDVAPIILHHHERFDGTGYPGTLKGEEIPLESRIITIAEAFDAMTSKSSYKQSQNLYKALQELQKNAGTQFDPNLVNVFINIVYRKKVNLTLAEDGTLKRIERGSVMEEGAEKAEVGSSVV